MFPFIIIRSVISCQLSISKNDVIICSFTPTLRDISIKSYRIVYFIRRSLFQILMTHASMAIDTCTRLLLLLAWPLSWITLNLVKPITYIFN